MPKNPAPYKMLALDKIVMLPEIQIRVKTSPEQIAEYTAMVKDEVDFEPIEVFVDGDGRHILGDGWHRVFAYTAAERKSIPAIIHDDDPDNALDNAFIRALGNTCRHGLRMSTEEKRRATAITLKRFPRKSNKEIARLCGVSSGLVEKIRAKGYTANEPRKKSEPKSAPAENHRTKPQDVEPVGTPADRPISDAPQENPTDERIKTLKDWKRADLIDFPDIVEIFETRDQRPILAPKNPLHFMAKFSEEGDAVAVPITGFRIKGKQIEIAADRKPFQDAVK